MSPPRQSRFGAASCRLRFVGGFVALAGGSAAAGVRASESVNYSLDLSVIDGGGFEFQVWDAETAPLRSARLTWQFPALQAREVWQTTQEAFGNFHFDENARSRWTTAVIESASVVSDGDRAILTGRFDIWADEKLELLTVPHLVNVGFNITFRLDDAQDTTAKNFLPTIHSSVSLLIPGERLSPPVLGWKSKGTTNFMLESNMRAIQVKLEGMHVLAEKGSDTSINDSGERERILGLGPQYSFTDLVNRGPILMFPQEQGAGRGREPLTFFGNLVYPYAGGSAFSSYSSVNAFVSTKGYGLISTSAEKGEWEFSTTSTTPASNLPVTSTGTSTTSAGTSTTITSSASSVGISHQLTFVKDFYDDKIQYLRRDFEMILFAQKSSTMATGTSTSKSTPAAHDPQPTTATPDPLGADLAARMGAELKTLLSLTAEQDGGFVRSAEKDFPDYETPSWAGSGALVSVEGGTSVVDAKLEELWKAGVPLAGAWIQDWSGLVSTSFAKRVVWDWRINRDWYPGWEAFVAKWRNRGVRMLTYINPYLSSAGATHSQQNLQQNLQPHTQQIQQIQQIQPQTHQILSEETQQTQSRNQPTPSTPDQNGKNGKNPNNQTLFEEAHALGYLVSTFVNSSRPLVLPSATDDFRFGILDLSRPDVRDWYSDVILCSVMMVKYPKRCPENESPEPLVWGWMADFGEYLPVAWEGNASTSSAGNSSSATDNSTSATNRSTNIENHTEQKEKRRNFFFDAAGHGRYPEQWALVNRLVMEKYKTLRSTTRQNQEKQSSFLGEEVDKLEALVTQMQNQVVRMLETVRKLRETLGESIGGMGTDALVLSEKKETHSLVVPQQESFSTGETDDADAILPFFRSASLLSSSILNSFWMGDQMVTFDACDGLQSAFLGHLNAGFSGHKHMHSDVGGYTMMDPHRYKVLFLLLEATQDENRISARPTQTAN